MNFPRELLSVALAVGFSTAFFAGHIFLFRHRHEHAPGYLQLIPAAGLYFLLWFVFLLAIRRSNVAISEFLAGGCTAGFIILAYMQMFSLTCRGFSLRILTDIDNNQSLNLNGIIRGYSEGRGLDWLMEKRLIALEKLGLIERKRGLIYLIRPFGAWIGQMGLIAKRMLRLGQGG